MRLIFFFLLIFTTLSCNTEKKADETNEKVYLILKTLDNPFFQEIEKGVNEENSDSNKKYSLITRAGRSESDISSQRSILNNILLELENGEKDIAAILLSPSSSGIELAQIIEKIVSRHKVKILLIDTDFSEQTYKDLNLNKLPYIGSSNFEGGVMAGQFIANKIDRNSKILVLNGVEGQETARARYDGFISIIDSLNSKGYSINVTARSANWRRNESREIVSSLLALGNTYDAIFGANDEMAIGAINAYSNFNNNDVVIVGFDAIDEAIDLVKENKMDATIAQDPKKMGKTAFNLINEDSLKENYLISTKVID